MKIAIKLGAVLAIILLAGLAQAQHTTVTATVKDPLNAIYRTCTGSANFVGQNTTPGAGPYTLNGGTFQTVVPISCDSKGQFQVSIADNNVITPTPSQWRFSLCTAIGIFPGPPICFNSTQTITGVSQDITAQLQADAATLPPYQVILETNGVPNGSQALLNLIAGANITIVDAGNGNVTISSTGGGGGGGGGGGSTLPGGTPGQLQYNNNNTSFAGLTNVAVGSVLTSPGTGGTPPIWQTKAIYDTRDWMTCDGNGSTGTDASTGMHTLLNTIGTNEATIRFVGSTTPQASCRIGNTLFPANVTLDFSGGGSLQLISSSTAPGGAGFVNGTSVECGAGATCAAPALSVTTGNTLVVMDAPYPGFTFKITQVTDNCNDFFIHVQQSLAGQPRNQGAWVASSATGGTCTVTATANGSLTNNIMTVHQYSGMGPVASLDVTSSSNAVVNPMTSGAATVTTGSLVIGFGGQPFNAGTCSAGAGFTQPAGIAGQTTNGFMCSEYQLSAAGGSLTATQNFTGTLGNQVYSLVALKPGNATATIWGGIIDPDQHKIFYNADSATGHGVIDFTGSPILLDVYPEWWGAGGSQTAAVNTPALQAAIWGAFGGGMTQARTNASGLSNYNRPLRIGALYQINDELKLYNTNGFTIYGTNRLLTGIQQTATNKRAIDGQSNTYGYIHDFSFSTQASEDTSHALVDIDWNGVSTPGDLKPQFLDLDHMNFLGNGAGAIGLEIAKSGGAAQGSNIYCRDCAFQSFTTACAQIGSPGNLAANALAIGFSGDFQGCTADGIKSYGGGYISFGDGVEESSMENGYSTQTGYDMDCIGTQGPCSMDYMRSESRRLIAGNDIVLHKSRVINQSTFLNPGTTLPVSSIVRGSTCCGDGAFYQVTNNGGAAGGVGTEAAPLRASSGTGTTLTDTNQTIAGAVTIKQFGGAFAGEGLTQATSGSTATLLNVPASTATVTGTLTSGLFNGTETVTQSVTGVTATEVFPTPSNPSVPLSLVNLSGTADSTHTWIGGTTGAVFTPNAAPTFAATSMLITAATGSPDSTHDWVGNSSGAHLTPSGAPVNQANFTVNGFTGMTVSVLTGKNAGCSGVITSNTATAITFSAGWTTRYAKLGCPFPDTTSNFLVEWTPNHGTVTDGGMTLQYLNEDAIDCIDTSGNHCIPLGRLEDVIIAGGQIRALNLSIDNLTVYRQDWFDNAGGSQNPQQCCEQFSDWKNVHMASTVGPGIIPYQGLFYQSWALPSFTGVSYKGAAQDRLGTRALVWDIGNVGTNNPPGSGLSANSVWIGGRTDNAAGIDATRNILEFGGFFGRGAPLPSASNSFSTVDQNGTDTDITGGPSTGAGTGGAINFWTSNPGASSQVVNSGLKRWLVSTAGHFFAGADNSYDIGASGASRPRDLFLGRNLNVSGTATLGSGSTKSISTGTASNTDLAGTLTLSTGTITYTFTGTYATAPVCVATDKTAVNAVQASATTTVLTINGTGSDVVNYVCIGLN